MDKITAHHAHVFPEHIREEGSVQRLLTLMDNCEISGAVCFTPFNDQLDGVIDGNSWLANEIKQHSELIGFGTIDFTRDDMVDQVERIYDLGFRGIKLHPAYQKFNILSLKSRQVYEAAQRRNLFLTFHTGIHWHRISDYRVDMFDEIVANYPQLRFSMEHVGGYHYFPEALAVIVNNLRSDNGVWKGPVYAGLTSVFTRHINRFWHLQQEQIEELVAQAGASQIIFGLDFPYNKEKETLIALERIRALPINDEERGLILGGSLKNVLGLT
jgi:predicted TIM-barrel fold metal-dependent hydrolase